MLGSLEDEVSFEEPAIMSFKIDSMTCDSEGVKGRFARRHAEEEP